MVKVDEAEVLETEPAMLFRAHQRAPPLIISYDDLQENGPDALKKRGNPRQIYCRIDIEFMRKSISAIAGSILLFRPEIATMSQNKAAMTPDSKSLMRRAELKGRPAMPLHAGRSTSAMAPLNPGSRQTPTVTLKIRMDK
jgi:hypothetical protein